MARKAATVKGEDAILLSIIIRELAREECPRSRNWIFSKLNGSASLRLIHAGTECDSQSDSIFSRMLDQIQKQTDRQDELRLQSLLQRAVQARLLQSHEEGRLFSVTEQGREWSMLAYRQAGDNVYNMQDEILFACLLCVAISTRGVAVARNDLVSFASSGSILRAREGSRLEAVQRKFQAAGEAAVDRGISRAIEKGWLQALNHRYYLTELGRNEGIYYFD